MSTKNLTNAVTIEDIITLQALGVHFHTYRLPTSPHKVRAYFSNIDAINPTLIKLAHLQPETKKLLRWHLRDGSTVASLI